MPDYEFESKLRDIEKKTDNFNLNGNCEKKYYSIILDDLDSLYNHHNNRYYFLFSINPQKEQEKRKLRATLIDKKRINFKKLLLNKLDKLSQSQMKSYRYHSCLETINQLEDILNSTDSIDESRKNKIIEKNKEKKRICRIQIDIKEANELLKNKKYEEAIKSFDTLILKYSGEKEQQFFEMQKEISISKYMINIAKENISLIKTDKANDIANNLEKIIDKYKNYSRLNRPVNELRKLYGKCLETIIETKQKNFEKCDEELIKYNSLADVTNLGYQLKNFKEKYEIISICNTKIEEKSSEEKIKYESDLISKNTIRDYLEQIKEKNNGLSQEIEQDIYTQVDNYNEELKNRNKKYIKINEWLEINKEKIKQKNFRGNVFAFLNSVNKQIIKFDLRPIQLISLLFLSNSNEGIFLQINTGEGKSLIIQLFAAYLALSGQKVDVISSSSVLADRDAEDPKKVDFFCQLNLTVGRASKDEYGKHIVYGDTQNFQAGILREEFKEKNVRFNRPFDCIIVDEVDSISLDNIITMTQLTDNFPGRSSFFFFY